MKKRAGLIVLGLTILLAGCGNSNSDDGYVQVEIEKIEDIKPASEVAAAGDTQGYEETIDEVSDSLQDESLTVDNQNTENVENQDVESDGNQNAENVDNQESEAVEDQGTESVDLNFEKDASSLYVVVVGDTSKEILNVAKEELSWQDVSLEIVNVNSFDQANELVANGKADGSLCVNKAYMDSYNTIHNSNLITVSREYYEPYAIFPGKSSSLGKCQNGAVIAVPQGSISVARSLYLLEQKGLIELKDGANYQACVDDIIYNPHNIKIETYDLATEKPDVSKYDFVIMDYNHAIVYDLNLKSILGYENRNSKLLDMFTVNLVTKSGNESNAKIQKLEKVLGGNKIVSYIKDTYAGAVVDY